MSAEGKIDLETFVRGYCRVKGTDPDRQITKDGVTKARWEHIAEGMRRRDKEPK